MKTEAIKAVEACENGDATILQQKTVAKYYREAWFHEGENSKELQRMREQIESLTAELAVGSGCEGCMEKLQAKSYLDAVNKISDICTIKENHGANLTGINPIQRIILEAHISLPQTTGEMEIQK